jgi:uncharacterized protein YjbJ (UPF0337 family)
MDKERIKGGLKKATGTVKEKTGQATGDHEMEAEGKVDKAEGEVRGTVGRAKDAARDLFKK